MRIVRSAWLFFLFLPFPASCVRQKIELEDSPEQISQPALKTPGAAAVQPLPAVKNVRVEAEEESFTSLQVDGKDFQFFELSIPPSFLWQPEERQLFAFLNRVTLAWEQASYRSQEERDAAFFFHSILLALLSGEDIPEAHFRELADFAMPLYLFKRIPSRHKPAVKPEDLERIAQTLWDHGFNLNHVRREDLNAYLKLLRDVVWKDRTFSPEDPWQLVSLREDGLQLSREDLASVRRCAANMPNPEGAACVFGKYRLSWKPNRVFQEKVMQLFFSAMLETGRGRDMFQGMLAAYQKRPGWFSAGMQFPVSVPQDEFILAAAGPLALVFSPAEPPGNTDWPQNLRQTDWENSAPQWMDLLGAAAADPDFRNCAPSILDALAAFLRYTHDIQGKPSDRLTSNHLSPAAADSAVMERLWSYVWFVHASATGHHTSLGIRSGCEKHVTAFLAMRAAWKLAAAGGTQPPDDEAEALRLFFGLLHHFHSAGRGENAPNAGKAETANILSDASFPELTHPDRLPSSMEAAWVLLAQPENFLLATAPRLLPGSLLVPQLERIREKIRAFTIYRVYLPALLRVGEDRISYRRAKNPLDHYLQLTSDARRVKLP